MSDNPNAVTNTRGIFKQDTIGDLQIKITDSYGVGQNPEEISIVIYNNTDDSVVVSSEPDKVASGFYIYDWVIPIDQSVGKYRVEWTYVIDGETFVEIQFIVVSSSGSDSAYYSAPRMMLRDAVEHYIMCAQRIPIYREQAKKSRDYKTFYFTRNRWNQNPKVNIYRNNIIVNDLVEVDYFNGRVVFSEEQMYEDNIQADYTFRWFSDEQIDTYIDNAIQLINSYPPMDPMYSITNIYQYPRYTGMVVKGAVVDALRTMMLCMQFQEPQQFFGGMEAAQGAFSNMETLKQNYEKELETVLDNKKYGPYPQSRTVTVPTYTLPGGRSRWFRYLFSGNL